jgi:hypothetical protein
MRVLSWFVSLFRKDEPARGGMLERSPGANGTWHAKRGA